MAFFELVLKARRLRETRLFYHDEKIKSIEISKGLKVHYTLSQKIRYKKILLKKKVKEYFQKITTCPEDSWFHEKAVLLRTDGTLENYVMKSIFGFLGGIFLTYVFFIFFVFQLNFSLPAATIWCSLLGAVLTLGLAFSRRVRCFIFLLMPQFFSKRGRQALMAYAFILALTGPAKNTLQNIGVLSDSLTCTQEQLKEAVKTIVDLIKEPFLALKDALSKVMKTIKLVIRKIKRALVAIKRLILSILNVIESVFKWLGSIVNMCNKKLGTPYDRCNAIFEDAVSDCKAKLGSVFGEICNITYLVGTVCNVVRPFDFICMLVSFVSDQIVEEIHKKVKKFTKHMKTMFYVKIKFSHSFDFQTNQSRSISDVSKGISTEIKYRTKKFLMFFDMMSFITSFCILFLLLRVIHYRHKWLTNSRFDNRYLTDYMREIDLRRTRLDQETILPLNPREKNKFVFLSSITLIKAEKTRLAKSAVFLSITSFKLLFHMAVDYSLYWILSMIRYHGRFQTKMQQPNSVEVHVSGTGFLAELYRSIIKAFSPSASEEEIDTVPCLPDPMSPDYDRYFQISSLIALCWLMAIFEPYGLRIRQVVMNSYYPDRAKERAVWLYNHILRSRSSFLKFARRQLRRKFGMKGAGNIEKVTCRERLTAICPILEKWFPLKQNACLLCGAIERKGQVPHIKCPTPGCIGIFCIQCFTDLQNLCTVCKSPLDYGDLSDISEEKDSSEEDVEKPLLSKTDLMEEEIKDGIGKVYEIEEGIQVREEEIDEISSSTEYSYTYQDDESQVDKHPPQRVPFKDIEAQELHNDVTTQIFNEPIEDVESGSDGPTCFIFRTRKKHRKLGKVIRVCPVDEKSISAAEEASHSSEEELLNIKLDDESGDKIVSSKRTKKKKRGKINKFITRVLKFSWFRRKKLLEKPAKPYEKKEDEEVISCSCTSLLSSSTSSSSSYNLKKNFSKKSKKKRRSSGSDEYEKNLHLEAYDSHRENRLRRRDSRNLKYPHEKCFSVKKLPRGLVPIAKETRYYEVDEKIFSPRELLYDKECLNILSDARTSSDTSRITETWNICGDVEYQNYQLYRAHEGGEKKMMPIKEDSQEIFRSKNTGDDSGGTTNDSKKYIDVTGISSDSSIKTLKSPESSSPEKMSEFVRTRKIKNSDKIVEKYPRIVSKIDRVAMSAKTHDERARQKKIIERRLLRRRYDQNYYSNSDNEEDTTVVELSTGEEEMQRKEKRQYEDDSPRRSNSSSENPNLEQEKYYIHRKKKMLYGKPELIEELKDDDRIKFIRKREDERQRRYDILRSLKGHETPRKVNPKMCRRSPHRMLSNKRNYTLPYQETEAFKNLVQEYRKKISLNENILTKEDSSSFPSENENKEVRQLFPFESYQDGLSIDSRFRKKNAGKCNLRREFLDQLGSESRSDMSFNSRQRLHYIRKKYISDHGQSNISLSEDTTDNNETPL